MILNWLFPKRYELPEAKPMWEYAEKPVYDHEAEHKETMAIIKDILDKLDEIKILVDEMKEEEKKKASSSL